MPLISLFGHSVKAVFTIILVAGAGVFLVRARILNQKSLQVFSKTVFNLMIPCLLFTKLAQTINLERLLDWWLLPISGLVFMCVGMILGFSAAKICGVPNSIIPHITTASGVANSGFLPIPLIAAICLVFPQFKDQPEAGDLGVAYISIYLMTFSPVLWTVCYNVLGRKKISEIRMGHFITPPFIGILLGLVVGLNPQLKTLFCNSHGFMHPVYQAATIIAQGAIPCALIVLGGILAFGPRSRHLKPAVILTVVGIKLVLLPILAIGYVFFVRKWGLIPDDLVCAIVLIIEAAAPPATNLAVISSLHKNHEDEMGALLFWNYLAAIPSLTILIMLAMAIFDK